MVFVEACCVYGACSSLLCACCLSSISPDLPHVQSLVSEFLWSEVEGIRENFRSVCGVPLTALPMATVSILSTIVRMSDIYLCVVLYSVCGVLYSVWCVL